MKEMSEDLGHKMGVLKTLLKVMYSNMTKKKMAEKEGEEEEEGECEEKEMGPLEKMAMEADDSSGSLSDEDKKEMLYGKKRELPKFKLVSMSVSQKSKPMMKKGKA